MSWRGSAGRRRRGCAAGSCCCRSPARTAALWPLWRLFRGPGGCSGASRRGAGVSNVAGASGLRVSLGDRAGHLIAAGQWRPTSAHSIDEMKSTRDSW